MIVGSGAGGGVIAAKLAAAGLSVVVLEMGGYYNEADFNQLELWAWQNLYWRGGPTPTADLNVTLQAGSWLGGGTVINWTNSLRTKDWVRRQWAERARARATSPPRPSTATSTTVWARIKVNDECSEYNRPTQAMQRARRALGWSFARINRNWDPARHDPAMAGYMGFGDLSGAKQSTDRTYLLDAVEHGRPDHGRGFVERVLVEGGRAAGVEALWSDRAGSERGARDRSRPAGGRGRGRARVAGGAAAIGDRRPGGRGVPAICTRPRPRSATTGRTCRPGGERRRAGWSTSSPHWGRLRLPDRGRAVHDRVSAPRRSPWSDAPPAQGRRWRTSATALLRRPAYATAAHGRVTIDEHGMRGAVVLDDRPGRPAQHRARGRGPGARPRRRRRAPRAACWRRARPNGGVGDDLDAFIAARAADPAACRRPAPVRRPPDGHLPHGARPADQRGQADAASCTTRPACGSATPRRSRRPRAPTR